MKGITFGELLFGKKKHEEQMARAAEEAQPISKRNLKKSLGKKNRKNRGKRRNK